MANKKITQINIGESYDISLKPDVCLELKPDGANKLFNTEKKLNMAYISDSVLGQVKFGGIWTAGQVTSLSALLKDTIIQASYEQESTGSIDPASVQTIQLPADTTTITNLPVGDITLASISLEGFYFITSANCTFAGIDFETGDWLIASGGQWQKVDNTDAITSVDNELIKLEGKTVSTNIIHKGSSENSFTIFDGVADKEYSIAAGTNNKDAIVPIVGSTLANAITVNNPKASGVGAIALGGGAEATSAGALAMGPLNRVGVTGFYWKDIDFTTNTITLVKDRSPNTGSLTSGLADVATLQANVDAVSIEKTSCDWKEGDTVSIVNNAKYPFCAKIKSVGTASISYEGYVTGGFLADKKTVTSTTVAITLDSLPFTEVVSPTLTLPDDYTIFACYKKDIATEGIAGIATQERWYPRSGSVIIGWAGAAFGVENLVSGSAGFSAGWNNWTVGDFGATFGRDNISGYAGFVAGLGNTGATDCSTVFGQGNKALRNPIVGETNGGNLIAGNGNITSAWNAAAIGRQLRATTNAQLVAGQFNAVTDERATFVVGNGNVGEEAESGYTGEILDGRKVLRSNAFTVYHSGRIEAGKSTTTTDSGKTLVTLDLIKGTGTNVGSNVFSLGTNNTYGHFDGSSIGATSNAAESLIVGNGNTAHGNQILIAGYNNKVGVNQGVALGEGNKVTGAQGFAANLKNTVAGASAAAFGESNTVNGQNSAAFGLRNKVLVATGSSNNGKNNIISGEDNTSSNWNNAAFGRFLDADTSGLTVVGQFNKTPSARAMFIVGNGNEAISGVPQTTTTNQTAKAYSRRNAFVAYYDGRCAAGADPVDDMDLVTKHYFENNATKVDWENINSNVKIVNKHKLTVTGDVAIEGALALAGDLEFQNITANGKITAGANPVDPMDVVTLDYLTNNYTPGAGGSGDVGNITTEGDNTNVNGNLNVTGDISLEGSLSFSDIECNSATLNEINGAENAESIKILGVTFTKAQLELLATFDGSSTSLDELLTKEW